MPDDFGHLEETMGKEWDLGGEPGKPKVFMPRDDKKLSIALSPTARVKRLSIGDSVVVWLLRKIYASNFCSERVRFSLAHACDIIRTPGPLVVKLDDATYEVK